MHVRTCVWFANHAHDLMTGSDFPGTLDVKINVGQKNVGNLKMFPITLKIDRDGSNEVCINSRAEKIRL